MTSNENDCKKPKDFDLKNHWDKACTKKITVNHGWCEASTKEASILNVGVGSSVITNPNGSEQPYIYTLFQRKS
ncbi:hypothetical protein SAMN04489761_0178 [Tenacibaculum sp. MAR_2009_124]|uniref:hypothetical protein n=1 Tax=Tenacibaculum sp. MAR_2009_124 TaxID=1250059 RepID=UPI00089D44F3|nr:hypothetical protein [Tenacibaculum sp. MAR_2009_124]SEB36642.1 hypothetical protein SAMN04489761_0178 [Tenacibaculum sp. MAR_2009_124]